MMYLTYLNYGVAVSESSLSIASLFFQVHLNSQLIWHIEHDAEQIILPSWTNLTVTNFEVTTLQVEVKLLIGETTILRTDILYDCGQSLNPGVDLGQIILNTILFCMT